MLNTIESVGGDNRNSSSSQGEISSLTLKKKVYMSIYICEKPITYNASKGVNISKYLSRSTWM